MAFSVYDTNRTKKQLVPIIGALKSETVVHVVEQEYVNILVHKLNIYPYKQQQNDFLCRFSIVMFISRTIMENTSFTLMRLLADASMNGQPHISASAWPSSVETSLWHSKSSLLATRRIGTGWLPFTLLMTFRIVVMSWNVWWFVSEYITMKPWPFLM